MNLASESSTETHVIDVLRGLLSTALYLAMVSLVLLSGRWTTGLAATPPDHGLLREVWLGIDGNDLGALTNYAAYPNNPDSTNYVTDLFEAPTDALDSYGQRVHGYVVPPVTGEYTFWIASDDNGALFLSSDEDPAKAELIAWVSTWTGSRQWENEPNQRSAPVLLTALKPYYISALMKEGNGGDNLAVRWLMPDGTDQGPVVATNLLPYGITFAPPVITEHPADTEAVEGGSASFRVTLATVGVYNFEWQRDRVQVPGANGPELMVSPIRMSDDGARFRCVVRNDLGVEVSNEAVLSVLPDRSPPTLISARNLGLNAVEVTFSEPVAAPSATTPDNYRLSGGATVTGVTYGSTPSVVRLVTSTLAVGASYALVVSNVLDLAQAPNAILPDSSVTFITTEFAREDVGMPPLPGSATPVPGGVDVGGSGDVGGNADSLQFAWQQRSGSFDLRVRVAHFDPTDPFAKAGLMARESLDADSRFAAALATPATVGCFLMTRTATGAAASISGFFPANYPRTWLRLKRSGSTFTTYASYDGNAWTELGKSTMALSDTVYLGLAAASRNASALAMAEFRDFGEVSGGSIVSYVPQGEVLGPSSRQTPLVISEIMYHPPDTNDMSAEFIELYNADLIAQDLTGHSISGSVDYAFPEGFVLPAGGFVVIARDPAEFSAVYGRNALGPFAGMNNLPNDAGTVQLRNPRGAILLEVNYGSQAPWPTAADGAGHSLVLARPSFGEADPRAWTASDLVGGSPDMAETVRSDPLASILINEWLAHTDDPQQDFIELFNASGAPVDISGCILTDAPAANRFTIPPGTIVPHRGLIAFDQSQLGFALKASGETLVLYNPDRTRALDAIRFSGQENGIAVGRYPDGAPELRRLGWPTPGAENESVRPSEIVINEIMYNPISGQNADEFVELHNCSLEAVDISGWRFVDGIDYTFPEGTVLPALGYLAVANDREQLLANHPNINTSFVFGDFQGNLSNKGERIALAKPDWIVVTNDFGGTQTNRIYIEVDEVTYGTGGQWGQWSDGLGSSLELTDPRGDRLRPSNWADSDETTKAPWSTIEVTGRLDNGDGGSINRLQIMLQGAGECLVDDVEVLPSGGGNRLANANFNTNLTGWTIQGNHRLSGRDATGGTGNSGCLHVRSPGRGDTAVNRIYAAISPALTAGSTATLRAKVRWLKGWPEFMLRTRGSYLEAAGAMVLPRNLGTPAAPNSRAVPNAGPAVFDVAHSPVIPKASEAVVVTARISDPDSVGTVNLRWRVDPGTTYTTAVMRDDGTSGDALAADGIFSVRIGGRTSGSLMAFYIEAADAPASGVVLARFPADAPARECLIRWGDPKPLGNLGVYRLWQRQADFNKLRSREPLANDNIDCTFAYGDGRVIYGASMRAKGSPWHGGSVGTDYLFTFPDDDQLLGARDVALVTVGNLGNDDTAQREQAAFWIGRQMGLPTLHRRHVFFFENGTQKQTVYEDTEEPNGLYVDRWWPDGQDGDLYKIEDWFEFNDAGNSFTFSRDATLERFTTVGGGYMLARYRWAWRKRAVADSANNYTNFFNLVTAVNQASEFYVSQVENMVDVENWLGVIALQHIVGNWDAYGYSRGKNAYIYKPVDGRFGMVPWDIDMVLGSGSDGPTTDIFGVNDPTIQTMWNTPVFRRAYLRAYLDAVEGPLRNTNIDPILDGRYAALIANGARVATTTSTKNWIASRRNYLSTRIASFDTKDFSIRSNSGNDFETSQTQVTLYGTAPIAAKTITVNGVPMPVTWTSTTNWSMSLVLGARTNVLQLAGLDSRDRPLAGAADSITIRFTGAQLPSPVGQVVINEIMYHSLVPDAEFIELLNISTTANFDLGGWRIDGVGYTFSDGSLLGPGRYAVIAANRDAFAAAYGFSVLPVGEFQGTLQDNGERLKLVKPGATPDQDTIVDQVRYDSEPPWSSRADGLGSSLQLVDARQDNWSVGNWTAASATDATKSTPGQPNSLTKTLPAFPQLYINEVLPENPTGLVDSFGDSDPWIELHNPGSTSIDLSGFYLTHDYGRLTQWPFPANTTIWPGQFLLIWADGEPGESAPAEMHTSFRLTPSTGAIALVRLQVGTPAVVDYINYKNQPAGLSLGSYPDGQPVERRLLHLTTPGSPNDPNTPPIHLVVNEWMADNNGIVLDPADADDDDWFELYNAGGQPADLSAYTLTDDLDDKDKFTIPNGTVVPPNGFLIVWADEETGQTTSDQLHVNFKLSDNGESIGLFTPNGSPVDTVTFGAQTSNVSEGRFPDGMTEPFVFMVVPTPGGPNEFATANMPPVLESMSSQAVDEGQTVRFTATATNAEPEQTLTFTLQGAPQGASIDPTTGVFSWPTTEADGPGEYSIMVRVTDDGVPARFDIELVSVTVRELNQPPVLDPISDVSVDERSVLSLRVTGSDPDLPTQTVRFGLGPDAPDGANIDELTGQFTWRPAEEHGEGTHTITVIASDSFGPPATTSRSFRVHVREVDDPPEFTQVGLQIADELSPFALELKAVDPDTPPCPVRFSIESAPSGLQLDPDTGMITWTPNETQGPSTYNVLVRADEVGGARSSSFAFSIVVNEVNQAPTLLPIADRTVSEGTMLAVPSIATDADLPPQKLTFSLAPGAPEGASIEPSTGLFTWSIGCDVGPSTNVITVRVTDETLDAKTTTQTFTVTVVAEPRIVINEIMYKPQTPGAGYVELHNWSTNVSWDISGWRLTGTDYLFPAGTTIAPDAFLVVAENIAAFTAAYGDGQGLATVTGDYVSQLGPGGGVIELYRSSTPTPETRVDRVEFRSSAPWPDKANGGGASLQLIDPRQDNSRVANWAAIVGQSTNAPRNVIPIDATWRYWQNASDPAQDWRSPLYNDSAWPAGKALLYVEGASLPWPKNTPLTRGPMSFLFRTAFQFEGNTEGAALKLNTLIDDGAVFYLNGTAFYWLGMTNGVIPQRNTAASRTVGDAVTEGPFVVQVDNLRNGDNVLAVEVHQISSGSTDIVFGSSVDVIEVRFESYTPGYVNSVRATLEPFSEVRLNELLASNNSGIRDNAGDLDPWIELVNTGPSSAALDGLFLSDTYADLSRWAFPAGAWLDSGQLRLVWADGESMETTPTEWHANFRLAPTAGVVVLSRIQNQRPAVLDFVEYSNLAPDQSYGYESPRHPDSIAGPLATPTPGAPNNPPPPPPVISVIVVGPQLDVSLLWSSIPGKSYVVESTTDIANVAWETVGQATATDIETSLILTAAGGASTRFYRVALVP